MPSPKPISKEQILAAMSQTLSNKAAARYLHVSYTHYKRWAKTYDATEDGYNSLFDQQLNQAGKGIPKFLRADGPEPALLDIIEGRIDKFFKQICLTEQPFIKDSDKTVTQLTTELIAKIGENIKIMRFTRYEMGEGLEKRNENFADEVQKTMGK